jgi:hypothetical protein
MEEEIYNAVSDFLTADVDLPNAPDLKPGEIWWEDRGNGWRYPWRITGFKTGYPCGEPQRVADDAS